MKNDIYFYIHIPFCYKKCPYCAFVSYEKLLSKIDLYTDRLIEEIKAFKTTKTVKSIYFGGGTPSVLKTKLIDTILNTVYSNFKVDETAEITLEANPISLKKTYLFSLKRLGINRLSIGIQSFTDKKLKILGRLHNGNIGISSVKTAQDIGFENISIDLIYGLNETKMKMEFELKNACLLNVQHISTYMLSIEKDTEFEKRLKNGTLKISSDEEVADLYIFISEYLQENGFEHYEISNFAHEGFYSKHNSAYWLGYDYRGFGLSASSFLDGVRFKNTDNLENYLKNKDIVVSTERLDRKSRLKEAFVLLLRMKNGVDMELFNKTYDTDIKDLYGKTIEMLKDTDMLKEKDGKIYLNGPKAMVVSNAILSELI